MVPNSTKVLQITILDIIDWNRIQKYQYSTKIHVLNRVHL